MGILRSLMLSAPVLLASSLAGLAQDRPSESDIERRIRELKEQFDKRMQELDRERERIQRELDRQLEQLRRDRGESGPRVPPSLDDILRSIERMLDRLGGMDRLIREFEDRLRRLEGRIPELREFRERVPREWFHKAPGEDRKHEFWWRFQLPPEGHDGRRPGRWLERWLDRFRDQDREHY